MFKNKSIGSNESEVSMGDNEVIANSDMFSGSLEILPNIQGYTAPDNLLNTQSNTPDMLPD